MYLHHTVCLEILFRFDRDNSPTSRRILHFIINCTSQLFLIFQNMLDFKRFVLSAFFRFYPDNSLLIDRNNHNSKLHFKRDEIFCQSYYPMQKEIQSWYILGSASNSWKIGHYELIDFYVWPLFFKCIFLP